MLRSIRISFLASVVALAFAACGGGSNPPDNQQDAGTGDGHLIQFDGPRNEGGQQQDAADGDGGGGACVPSGGVAAAGICKNSKPCTCPLDCFDTGDPKMAGACWPLFDTTTGCANATDVGIRYQGETTGHCFPSAALTGTFSIPIAADINSAGGTATGGITINGVTATWSAGFALHDTTNGIWSVNLTQANITGYPYTVLALEIDDAVYNTTPINMKNNAAANGWMFEYKASGSSYSMTSMSQIQEGTLTFTAAPTGATGTVEGSFTAAKMFGNIIEYCGPNTTAC
jgi:hypothetical protein